MREELENEVLDLITESLVDHNSDKLKHQDWIGDCSLSEDFSQEEEQKFRQVQRDFITLCEKWKREVYKKGFTDGLKP